MGFVPFLLPGRLHAAGSVLPGTGGAGIESTIIYSAKDSVVYDLDKRTMELRGSAAINHESTTLKAPDILIDLNTELIRAFGVADSSKQLTDPAVFSDSKGSFNSEIITYNFRTGRGETSNVSASSTQFIFKGEHVTRTEKGELQISDGTFTTCDEELPHFWVASSNLTIIPDEKVVARPLVLYLHPEIFSRRLPAIPVLILPYMAFSFQKERSSGFLTPGISSQSNRGYYLSNLGYFWAIDDLMDLRLEGDLAFNKSWRLANRFRYTKQHDFSGVISGEYKRNILNSDESVHRDWNVHVVHNQSFDPSTTLDANLDFQGGDRIYDLSSMNSETILTEQANARASLAKTFNDEQSIASLFYDRTKGLRSLNASDTFGLSFYQNRLYPFRSGYSSEREAWIEDISITSGAMLSARTATLAGVSTSGYSANTNVELGYFREFAEGYKALFTQGLALVGREPVSGGYEELFSEKRIVVPFRVQSTLFHYLNVNPALTVTRFLNSNGAERDFSSMVFSVDASTRLYGLLQTALFENMLGLKALRHTFIPTISYAWNPSFSGTGYDYYHHFYDWTYGNLYNRFDNRWYSGLPEGESRVGISLRNLFHAKFRGSSDQQEEDSYYGGHSVQLLSLNVATAYNFAADALQLEPLSITAQSNALSPNFLLSAGGMYDFYSYDPVSGERVNRYNSDEGKGLLRFVRGFLNMGFSLQGRRLRGASLPAQTSAPGISPSSLMLRERYNNGDFNTVDYALPWQLRLALYFQSDRSNPLEPSSTSLVTASSKFALSRTLQAAVHTGYDFQHRELIFPMLQLYRDLHCWQVGFQWVPSGSFRSFSAQVALKVPEKKELQ